MFSHVTLHWVAPIRTLRPQPTSHDHFRGQGNDVRSCEARRTVACRCQTCAWVVRLVRFGLEFNVVFDHTASATIFSSVLTRSRHEYPSLLPINLVLSEKTRVQETVRNAAKSLSDFLRHSTTESQLSVYDVIQCQIQ